MARIAAAQALRKAGEPNSRLYFQQIVMTQEYINGNCPSHEAINEEIREEVEKDDDFDAAKNGGDTVNHEEERRLVRKLDLW